MSFTSVWHPTALRLNWPGAAVAVVVALAATYVSANFGGPQLLYALFFGLTFHFLSKDATCQPGIEFCSKTLLRTGVALLGAKITFSQITALGVIPIATAVCALVMTMLFGWRWSRWLGRPDAEGVLSGGAVAICGASAALAIAAVMRVACLVPVVLVLSILFRTRSGQTRVNTPPLVPFFLIVFVWLMIANSYGFVPPQAASWINTISRACLVTAIAACVLVALALQSL